MVELHSPDLVFVHFNCSPPTVCTSDRNPRMKIPPPIAFWVWSWRCAVVASVAVCGAVCPPRRAGPRPAPGPGRGSTSLQQPAAYCAPPASVSVASCTIHQQVGPVHTGTWAVTRCWSTHNKQQSPQCSDSNMLLCNDGLNHNLTSILLERTNLSIKY